MPLLLNTRGVAEHNCRPNIAYRTLCYAFVFGNTSGVAEYNCRPMIAANMYTSRVVNVGGITSLVHTPKRKDETAQ